MENQTASTIEPRTQPQELDHEFQRYKRLIDYIHGRGMTVGIRPFVMVRGTPENRALGHWHGNIKPANVQEWFRSLREFLNQYIDIAADNNVEEFTVGAELYSMTVGLEDQWPQQPFGFPAYWISLVKDIRQQLPSARLMYDINYTDATNHSDGTGESGGELQRWVDRLVKFKPAEGQPDYALRMQNWQVMRQLWKSFDAIGIDNYRSLAPKGVSYPNDYESLVDYLSVTAASQARDLTTKLRSLNRAAGSEMPIYFKETGFKSCTGCFIDPYAYGDRNREKNVVHQAAAYKAFLDVFTKMSWLKGIDFWDVSVNPQRPYEEAGFSPLAKVSADGRINVEDVIRLGWGD